MSTLDAPREAMLVALNDLSSHMPTGDFGPAVINSILLDTIAKTLLIFTRAYVQVMVKS